jgi:hypothetical protein
MLLRAAHARRQILEAIHVQAPTAVARGQDALALGEALHAVHHLGLEGPAVVPLGGGGATRRRCGKQRGWGAGDGDRGCGVQE